MLYRKRSLDCRFPFHCRLQHAGQLVRTGGAAAGAVNALETAYGLVHLHSPDQGSDTFGVAVAAAGIDHAVDHVSLKMNVNAD